MRLSTIFLIKNNQEPKKTKP